MTPFEEFTARLLKLYWDNDCCDIDGATIQDLAVKSGIAIEKDGDVFMYDELGALMKELK